MMSEIVTAEIDSDATPKCAACSDERLFLGRESLVMIIELNRWGWTLADLPTSLNDKMTKVADSRYVWRFQSVMPARLPALYPPKVISNLFCVSVFHLGWATFPSILCGSVFRTLHLFSCLSWPDMRHKRGYNVL